MPDIPALRRTWKPAGSLVVDVDVGGYESDGGGRKRGRGESVSVGDIPFELVGEIACAGAVAEAGNVESLTATRHDC